MEPRAHHILIGFFTLATAIALMGFVLWLEKSGSEGQKVAYDIVFDEDVKGLAEGSPVLYTGIAVGEVDSMRLDPEDPSKVWTRITIKSDTPMRATTTARMSLANITGASVILLENDDPTSPPLVSTDDNVPVIPSKPSPFNQLRTSGEELLVNISSLVNNASDVLSTENSKNLSRILSNLEQTTSALAEQKQTIGQGINDLADASSELKKAISQTSQLLEQFNQQFAEHGSGLLVRADQSLESLADLTTSLSELVDNNREALTQSIHGMTEIGPALTSLEQLISNLNEITRKLEENPGGYILSGEKLKDYQP